MSLLPELILGLSLFTPHANYPNYNHNTPGVYLLIPSHNLLLGTVKNSYHSRSNYLAYAVEADSFHGLVPSLILGGITGYEKKKLLPLISPGISYGYFRAQFLPGMKKDSHSITFSIEFKIN